jgi:TRAP transporter TAXI family solute receptor
MAALDPMEGSRTTMRSPSLLVASLVAPLLMGTAHAQTVSLITTPAGSFTNSAGQAIAKTVTEKAKVRLIVQAQASSGFDELDSGTVEFNLSNSFDATFVVTGTGEYAGQPPRANLRHVASLIPYRVAMHVRAGSDIKTIADLRGKRVSSEFNAQKTIARIVEAHLANGGLGYKDVVGVPAPNVVRQAEDFKAGKVDVLFFALGSGAVKEASAAVGGLRVLEINAAPDAVKRVQAVLPGSYVIEVSPHPALDAITKPTKLVAFDMVLNASVRVPNDVIYKVARALHEGKKELMATFPPFAIFMPERMAKPVEGVTMHPGALKFYQEAGLWPPK